MKKLIISLVVAVFVSLLLVITVGAQEINKETTVTLTGSFEDVNGNTVTTVNLYDSQGDALIWYLNPDQKLVSAKVGDLITVSTDGQTSFNDRTLFYQGANNATFAGRSVVVVNLRDNVRTSSGVCYDGQIKTFDSTFQFGAYNVSDRTIEYFYFPTSTTRLADRMFQYTPIIVADILPGTNITSFGAHSFNWAKKLKEIFIPNDITSFHYEKDNGMFTHCESLTKVTFEENSRLEDAGMYTFYCCYVLKELYLPNSVKTAGNRFVQYCRELEVLSLGASFETFKTVNGYGDMWFTYNASKLKEVYIPGTLDITQYNASSWKQIFDSANNTYTIYFTGTSEQFENILAKFKEAGTNGNIVNAAANGRIEFVSDCQAFYGNKHVLGNGEYKFVNGNYVSNYALVSGCTRTGCTEKTTEVLCGPLFENKGYSKSQDNTSFTYGISINDENIAKYEELTSTTVDYGFIIGLVPTGATGDIVNADGTTSLEMAVIANFIDIEYQIFNVYHVKMFDITADKVNTSIYCCAFVIDGSSVSYMGNNVTEKAVAISVAEINKIEIATPPQQSEEEQA